MLQIYIIFVLCQKELLQRFISFLILLGPDAGDSCAGDSGGPLMVQSDEEGPMYLRGIVSFGKRKCNTGFPGVYTDISYYIDWIKENLRP